MSSATDSATPQISVVDETSVSGASAGASSTPSSGASSPSSTDSPQGILRGLGVSLTDVFSSIEADSHVDEVESLVIIVFGASGDLAKKKTFPALFSLFVSDLLPSNTSIIGYARSKKSTEQFRTQISGRLDVSTDARQEKLPHFLERITYVAGSYDRGSDFRQLHSALCGFESNLGSTVANRLFYLALPPSVFGSVVKECTQNSLSDSGFNRFIIEKPFGHDSDSSAALNRTVSTYLDESQIFRIDHYLGKEMVQNLMTLRFANSIFESLWNAEHILGVKITFKEDIGTGGRGGYFDSFGIIRDVMQNHLMQVMTLVAMERPAKNEAEAIRDAKVDVLKHIRVLHADDVIVGQYEGWTKEEDDRTIIQHGYRDDKTVPDDSVTPTFAQAVMYVDNERWQGVPWVIKCGKGLDERKMEIRVQFKDTTGGFFGEQRHNELVMRVQPNEAIYMKMAVKKPGLGEEVLESDLDLTYRQKVDTEWPDAYVRLIYDVIKGSHQHFVRDDELARAWEIFTPLLHELESKRIEPIKYPFGSRGPPEADEVASSLLNTPSSSSSSSSSSKA